MKRVFRSVLGLVLAVALAFGGPATTVFADTATTKISATEVKKLEVSAEDMGANVSKVLVRTVPSPTLGTFGGEWTVIALARSDYDVPKNYFTTYYNNVVSKVKEAQGKLSSSKYTEYSRVILGLTSIGRDPRNVGGYNLVSLLADFDNVKKQGINGPIFALLALDSANYDMPEVAKGGTQNSRDDMVDYILSKEIDGGGWALTGTTPDPDITAMALQALAKYKSESGVSNAIDRGIDVLLKLQKSDGGYASWGTTNAESIAQVIVALKELGIDPETDSRFIQSDGSWLLSALAKYYVSGKGFRHTLSGDVDAMATDQCAYALAAYNRGSLYDMTDVSPINLEITAFSELNTSVKSRLVANGTDLDSLKLPTSLTATVNGKKTTIDGITWDSDSNYDSDTAGTYTFTAKLPDGNYELADKVDLPQITVTVKSKNGSSGDSSSGTSSHSSGGSSGSSGKTTAAASTAVVTMEPDDIPVVIGDKSAITATVSADVTSIVSAATAEDPEKIKIATPTAAILEQLKNSAVKTVNLAINVPKVIANNTNTNAKVTINVDQSVLQMAKDAQKDITLSVVNGDTGKEVYSWTFSGSDLKNSVTSVTNVNLVLNVSSVKNVAAASSVVAGNTADKQASGIVLQFGNSGLLPSTVKVKVYVGDQEGCTANSKLFLYYLNSTTKALEQLSQCEYTVDENGYVTVSVAHCSDYVLLTTAATNPYPVKSDTAFTSGVKGGKTYTFGLTVSGKAVPCFTVGNSKAFTGSVKRVENKCYYTVQAIGTAGTMTAVYSTLQGQKPVVLGYISIVK